MASEILQNLDDIDLSQVVLGPADLDKILPQCGDMRQIDHLAWVNEEATQCVGIRQIRNDEFWVPGHIPGRPLYPGVLMIEAAAQCSRALHRLKSKMDTFVGFTRCDDVVFRGQVVPGDTLHFITHELDFKPRRFIAQNQAILNGKLVFEAKVTGMTM